MTDIDFDSIIQPYTRHEFLAKIFGRQFAHLPGRAGRFSHLFPWDVLNRTLEHHVPDSTRVKLVKEGVVVPADEYITSKHPRYPRLMPAELTSKLRDGATLIMNSVHEQYAPLLELAERVETVLRVRIQVNMYAGWRASRGFDLHWDDHDAIILQLYGRKHWQIHGETTRSPVGYFDGSKPLIGSRPIWEGTLNDGDALYIPKG